MAAPARSNAHRMRRMLFRVHPPRRKTVRRPVAASFRRTKRAFLLFRGSGRPPLALRAVRAKDPAKIGAWSPFHDAAKGDGSVASVVGLVAAGFDIDARDSAGHTLLHRAVAGGRRAAVAALLWAGAATSLRDPRGQTPLAVAVANGFADAVGLLLSAGADANATLDLATACPQATLLHVASSWPGGCSAALALLAGGADVHAMHGCNHTPLHVAAASGLPDTVALLVSVGARLESVDTCLWTSLHWAANSGSWATVDSLIKFGADTAAKTNTGLTVLHVAASSSHAGAGDVVAGLLAAGHDATARDVYGRSPLDLHLVSTPGDAGICNALLEAGAPPNGRGSDGWTPLQSHLVLGGGKLPAVKALLVAGADSVADTPPGYTLQFVLAASAVAATVGGANGWTPLDAKQKGVLEMLTADWGLRFVAPGDAGVTAVSDRVTLLLVAECAQSASHAV